MIHILKFMCLFILIIIDKTHCSTSVGKCASPLCLETARRMRSFMNFKTRPCTNFYDYACGNYPNVKSIPPSSNIMNMNEDILMEVKRRIIEFLKIPNLYVPESTNVPESTKKAKIFFDSCINTDAREKLGFLPMAILLKRMKFPVRPPYIGTLPEPLPEFSTTIATVRRYIDLNFPFRIEVGVNSENKLFNRLEIRVPVPNTNSKLKLHLPKSELQTNIKETLNLNESERRSTSVREIKQKMFGSTQSTLRTKNLHSNINYNVGVGKKINKNLSESENVANEAASGNELSPKAGSESKSSVNEKKNTNYDPEMTSLVEYMMKVANEMYDYIGIKVVSSKIDYLKSKIIDVSHTLHYIEQLAVDANKEENGEFTLEELQKKTDSFAMNSNETPVVLNWKNLITSLYHDNESIRKRFISGELKIFVEDEIYLKKVVEFLSKLHSRLLYKVLWWSVVRSYIMETTGEAESWEEEYRKNVGLKVESREEYCLKATVDLFDFAAAYNFVDNNEIEQAINTMESLILPSIREAVIWNINSTGFNARTRMIMLHKHSEIIYRIGYNSVFKDPLKLDLKFTTVVPIERNFFFTRLVYNTSRIKSSLMRVDKRNNNVEQRYLSPLASKIEYSVQENTVYIPIVVLLYSASQLPLISLKLGVIGPAIAAAIFHLIFLEGSEYTTFGVRSDWWNEKEKQLIDKQFSFLLESYKNVFYAQFNNMQINAAAIEAESKAEYYAIEITIAALTFCSEKNPETRMMLAKFPPLNSLQLLTLSWAQSKCEIVTEERLYNTLKKGTMPPARDLVHMSTKASHSFLRSWSCLKAIQSSNSNSGSLITQ